MSEAMVCPICGQAAVERRKVPFVYGSKFLGEFDADVCPSCGEALFTEEASGEINRRAVELRVWGIPPVTPTLLGLGAKLTRSIDILGGFRYGMNDESSTTVELGTRPWHIPSSARTIATALVA